MFCHFCNWSICRVGIFRHFPLEFTGWTILVPTLLVLPEMYCNQDQPNRRRIIDTNYQIHGHTLEVVDSSKYLGVTISEDLTWRKHIDDTVNKANKTLGFVRRNLSACSASVNTAAYTTMVRPRLEYLSTVWDPHHNKEIHSLEQVQRRAARFVHRNYTERTPGCVTIMVQSLGWESLQHRRYTHRILKIQHGVIDISPDFIQTNNHRARVFQCLGQLHATNDAYRNSFILGPSANGTGYQRMSPTSRLFRDSG